MLELSKLEGTPFSGGGADIFKCFDQIVRVLLLDLLVAGGFPPRLARAYKTSTSNYTIATLLLGGLGRFTGTFVASPRDVHLA